MANEEYDYQLTPQELALVEQIKKKRQDTIITATEFIYTAKNLRLHAANDKVRYERFPQNVAKFRQAGFAMNPIEKVHKYRAGDIDIIGPHSVVPTEGKELNISKYYSNQEIDYKKFVEERKALQHQ
ncbi:hypothetical protein DFA_03182 [Cavenderia fasciculata]|uniref:Uncharacterized protein n=1 Tax=Cavenderia fasciculata TaxID=261658 RepID=F4PGV3_CACFS|nr:uncharacterized protein DFA_03182 [Cavenderia fasciculata]EGG24937.1 hypothetical protein DFA_03182 [Cavenderia fasciculata]|eukprot:XP_004362788.1 hypothetical protein DFA_03182 [Cavenderia fasciculata]